MISRPVLCDAYVGRREELEHLTARRRLAGDARGGLVVVAGEAGIGKSRLIDEFVQPVARGTARVGRVECREFAQDPFGPIEELLAGFDPHWRLGRSFETENERLDAIVETFERLSDRRTTVAIVEDIHWADKDLVGALRILAARAATRRLLFVVSVRDNDLVPENSIFVAFGQLMRERAVSMISLAPLDEPATLTLLDHALKGGYALSRFVMEDIAQRSDGNPLFAEELARHAIDRQSAGKPAALESVPLTLQAVVRQRLQSCSQPERQLLAAASLCGRVFDRSVLDRIASAATESRDSQLAHLCGLQLVSPVEGKPHHFAFRHALVRDVLYGDLRPSDARPIHAEIARALATSPNPDDYVADIAYHYWQSGEHGLGAEAYAAAARAARKTLAYAQAVRWYERAADALENEADADAIRLELARTYAAAEQLSRALALYEALVGNAQRRGDAAFVVRARKLMAGLLSNDGRRDEAIALLERTIGELPGDDRQARAELLVRVTTIHAMRQRTDEARATMARFQPDDLTTGTTGLAEYFLLRAQLNARDGRRPAWHDDFARARAIFEALPGGAPYVRFSHVVFSWQAWALGLLELSRAHLDAARTASEESAAANSDVPLMLALSELHLGRFDAAQTWLQGVPATGSLMARKLRAQIGVEIGVARADESMVATFLDLALVDEAERKDDAYGFVRMCCSFGAGLALLGRDVEARIAFGRAAKRLESVYEFVPAILTLTAHRPDLRARMRALLAEAGDSLEPRFAAAALYLIDAEGEPEDSPQSRRDALAAMRLFDELGWAVFAARAAERVDRRDAIERYRRIGHVAGVRRLAETLTSPVAGDGILTARESAVVRALAEGATNREAALALEISEKTIEKHLSAVYRKFGFRSRLELLAFARSAGLDAKRT